MPPSWMGICHLHLAGSWSLDSVRWSMNAAIADWIHWNDIYQKSIKYLLIKFWSALSSFTQFREPCTRFSDYWFRTVLTQRKPLAISGTSHHGQNIDVSFTFAVQGTHHSCLLFNNSWLRPQRPLRIVIKKDAKNSAFLVIWPRNFGRIKGSPLYSRAVKGKSRIRLFE